jgi:hypothetical protein
MPMTAEERAEISRANGRRSRGPASEAGKMASSKNAMKHGARAKKHTMPNEDPDMAQQRKSDWVEYYRPRSPAARHLIDRCVDATLVADRSQAAHDEALAEQVEAAGVLWDREQEDAVAEAWGGLEADPLATIRALSQNGHGLRAIMARWERLKATLAAGGWGPADCDEALRLLGARPGVDRLSDHPDAYLTRLRHLQCRGDAPAELAALLEPEGRPSCLTEEDVLGLIEAPRACAVTLGYQIDEYLAGLRFRERVLEEKDSQLRRRAMNHGLMLQDETKARLYFRYQAESRSTFHRGVKELMATLKRDEEARTAALDPSGWSGTDGLPRFAGRVVSEAEIAAIDEEIAEFLARCRTEPNAAGFDRSSPNEPGVAAAEAEVTPSAKDLSWLTEVPLIPEGHPLYGAALADLVEHEAIVAQGRGEADAVPKPVSEARSRTEPNAAGGSASSPNEPGLGAGSRDRAGGPVTHEGRWESRSAADREASGAANPRAKPGETRARLTEWSSRVVRADTRPPAG